MTENIDHLTVKKQVAERYKAQGYNVELEYKAENGMIVDVFAEKEEETVAVEVGALNGEERKEELLNIFDEFQHIPLKGRPETRKSKRYSSDSEGVTLSLYSEEDIENFQKIRNFVELFGDEDLHKDTDIGSIALQLAVKKAEEIKEKHWDISEEIDELNKEIHDIRLYGADSKERNQAHDFYAEKGKGISLGD